MLQALRYAGAALLVLLNGDKHIMVRPCCSLAVGCWWRRVLVSLGRSWGYRFATLVRAQGTKKPAAAGFLGTPPEGAGA